MLLYLLCNKSHYENVPFEIPENWCWTTLGEVFTLQAGKNITAKEISDKEDTIYPFPCYGGNGLRGYVSSYNRTGRFPLIGRQGALCGNINVADGLFYATEHAVVVESYCNIDVDWAVYALIYLNLNQYATSTAQPGLSVATINEVLLPVPPIDEQKRIANEIEKWFDLIKEIESGKVELKSYIKQTKSKILDLAISGKLVPQDPEAEPSIELLKRINPDFEPCDNSHYENLPENWCIAKVKDVFVINPRNKAEDNTIAGFIPMTLIDDGYSNTFSYEKRKWGSIKTGFTHFADGDVAVAKISPCLENRKSIVLRDLPNAIGAGTTELHVFRSSVVVPEYALYFFKSEYFIRKCVGTFNGVVGQQRVGKNIIEEIQIPIPPINEQTKIVSTIETIFTQLNTITAEL